MLLHLTIPFEEKPKTNAPSDKLLGKYGRMHRAFLTENNPILLNDMILTEILFPHLWEIDETARRRVKQVTTELLEKNPAPDKETQQMQN